MPAKMPAKKTAGAKSPADFQAAFTGLKKIFDSLGEKLEVKQDNPKRYYLDMRGMVYSGRPVSFGAVMMQKNYISFHLMPVYGCPELLQRISPALKKRMQGKACFNFTAPDEALFAELSRLTADGYEKFHTWLVKNQGPAWPGKKS